MNHVVTCSCGEVIVKALNNDTKIRSKIVVFREEGAFAVCKSCNAEVQIPIKLDEVMLKSMSTQSTSSVRLYIRNMSKTS